MRLARTHAYVPYSSLIRACAPACLCPLPIINTRLCAYAPLPSSISALRAFALLLQNTVGPRAKKFNLVRNDHGPTQRYEFSSDSNGSRNLRYGACFKQSVS